MIIDERTSLDADAGEATARALQRGLTCGMLSTTSHHDVTAASRNFDRIYGWSRLRGCAVSVEADEVSIADILSHEAAIAKIERHLRGTREIKAPADPLCKRQAELP
jgi:hypothetical protein